MRRSLTSLAIAAAVLAQSSSAWACPMCKYALESDENEPKAYMISILFMIGMITGLFAAVAVFLWWVSRQEKMILTAAGYQHLFENGVSQLQSSPQNPSRPAND
jgi:uncharacterized membrane protein